MRQNISIYVHIPWCVRKCPYCDFNSHPQANGMDEAAYVAALLRDLEYTYAEFGEREITSIFFGGGTPSLFSAQSISSILQAIHKRWPIAVNTEITLEANPGTLEQNKFRDFHAAGINRLSLGIQSFNDTHLTSLGRIHNADNARRAINSALSCGIQKINLDLMYGLPQQTLAEALDDLTQAIKFNPTHISWYQLTLEPNTAFYLQPPTLPDEDSLWEIQEQGQMHLAQAGFKQYEVSAYTKNGQECLHNRNYWEFGDYLGVGAGAHGKISASIQPGYVRTNKLRHPRAYMEKAGSQDAEHRQIITDPNEIIGEYMLNRMRLNKPLPLSDFENATGLTRQEIISASTSAINRGLIIIERDSLHQTLLGWRFLNDLNSSFLTNNT